MKSLWNEITAVEATNGEGRGHWQAARIEIDSRKVQLGDLFVAIKGARVDGHNYVADAFARGAVAAVVSQVPENLPRMGALVVVPDTLDALVAMAKYARSKSKAKIIGVTGSLGKTSTKEMLRLGLAAHGKTYANSGNFNNHIGTPLSLANLPMDAAFGIFEMGMNRAGEIAYLSKIVRPHVAIITNIEAVHMEFFGGLSAIADAKAEIFTGAELGTFAILNADSEYCNYLREKAAGKNVIQSRTFGESADADVRLISYKATVKGCDIVAETGEHRFGFTLGATGRHFASGALAVLATADALQLPVPKTAAALADFTESEGRGKLLPLVLDVGKAWLIDDSYNASPTSMKAAITKLDEVWQQLGGKGRKVAALGDMLELGEDAPHMHSGLAQALVAHDFQLVCTAGPLMQHLNIALPKDMRGPHMLTAQQLLPVLQKTLKRDDVLLVKGSHGSKMYEVAEALRKPNQQEK